MVLTYAGLRGAVGLTLALIVQVIGRGVRGDGCVDGVAEAGGELRGGLEDMLTITCAIYIGESLSRSRCSRPRVRPTQADLALLGQGGLLGTSHLRGGKVRVRVCVGVMGFFRF